jgi:hypothetical protein
VQCNLGGIAARCYYDAQGRLVARDVDNSRDGRIDFRFVFTYTRAGQLQTKEQDENLDGRSEHIERYRYDSRGRWTTTEVDEGGDGTIDARCRYTPPCPGPAYTCEGSRLDCD